MLADVRVKPVGSSGFRRLRVPGGYYFCRGGLKARRPGGPDYSGTVHIAYSRIRQVSVSDHGQKD